MLVASCNKKVICFLSCTFNIFKCVVPDVQRGDKSMGEDMSTGFMVVYTPILVLYSFFEIIQSVPFSNLSWFGVVAIAAQGHHK